MWHRCVRGDRPHVQEAAATWNTHHFWGLAASIHALRASEESPRPIPEGAF